jgi:hypothetical protein
LAPQYTVFIQFQRFPPLISAFDLYASSHIFLIHPLQEKVWLLLLAAAAAASTAVLLRFYC